MGGGSPIHTCPPDEPDTRNLSRSSGSAYCADAVSPAVPGERICCACAVSFFNFPSDRFIAQMLILQHAIGIDTKGMRDRIDPEPGHDGTIPSPVPSLHPGSG
jgi:hypothetical protein